ncbi:hypothetical protein Sgri01_06600 [Streptomyces griseus]
MARGSLGALLLVDPARLADTFQSPPAALPRVGQPGPPQRVRHRAVGRSRGPLALPRPATAAPVPSAAALPALAATGALPLALLRGTAAPLAAALLPAAGAAARAGLVVEAQRQRDPLARYVDVHDLDLHDVPGLHHVARVLHEGLRQRRDVDQAVLVDADVDERAERRDVRHDALQHHARLQVAELLDALLEGRRSESGPGVAPRLLQLLEDVRHGRQPEHVVHEVRRAQCPQGVRVADQRGHLAPRRPPHPPHHRIGLGVHAGAVQGVVAAPDPQEARTLLVRLRAEPRHVLEGLAGPEGAVGVPVRDDVLGEPRADARHPGEQRRGGGVDVHADPVHTVLDDRVQRTRQLHLGQVVLVLADADRLRVDLHQLGQRVLEPPRDGDRSAQRHIHVGQFLRGERGGGVDRGARLRDHHLGELQLRVLVDQFTGELVRLTGRGAVADRDQVDRVLLREVRELRQRLVPPVRGHVRVDHIGGHHLAGGVDDRDLHPRTETGVQAQRGAGTGRGGEQKVAQVRGEDPHRLVLRRRAQPQPQVDAQVHLDPGPPRPPHGVAQPLVARAAPVGDLETAGDHVLVRGRAGLLGRLRLLRLQHQVEHVLLLAAQHREHPVRGQRGERLGEGEVVGELRARLLLALADLRREPAARPHPLAQLAGQVGVLGEPLGEDRPGPVQGGGRVRDALVAVHERGGGGERIDRGIAEQTVRQRFEPGLPGDLRLRPPLRLERQVDVLQAGLGLGGPDGRLQRRVELALFPYGIEDRRTPLLQLPQIPQPFLQRAQLRIVEGFGRLLAVARDERHGRSAVEQLDGRPDLSLTYAELLGDPAFDGRRHGFPTRLLVLAVLVVPGRAEHVLACRGCLPPGLHCAGWPGAVSRDLGGHARSRGGARGGSGRCGVSPGRSPRPGTPPRRRP